MRGVNHVFLCGLAGHDPELRTTPNGKQLCELRIAIDRPVREGEGWGQVTDWHRITFWEALAEQVQKRVQKGQPIAVEAELRPEVWQDKDGKKQHRLVVVGRRLHLMPTSRPRPAADEAPSRPPAADSFDGAEIPF